MPDRTFVFSMFALALCLVALGYLMIWPVWELAELVNGAVTYRRVSILEYGNLWAILVSVFPTLIVGASILTLPKSGRVQRNHKINVVVGALVMWVFVVMFQRQIGIVYIPAATMLTSVAVLVFVRQRAWGKEDFATDAEALAAAPKLPKRVKSRRRRGSGRQDSVGRRPRRRRG